MIYMRVKCMCYTNEINWFVCYNNQFMLYFYYVLTKNFIIIVCTNCTVRIEKWIFN